MSEEVFIQLNQADLDALREEPLIIFRPNIPRRPTLVCGVCGGLVEIEEDVPCKFCRGEAKRS